MEHPRAVQIERLESLPLLVKRSSYNSTLHYKQMLQVGRHREVLLRLFRFGQASDS
jgi:hypothetical protein